MPELPEVETTARGINENVAGLRIEDIWTNYNSSYYKGSETIKDPSYFLEFKKAVKGKQILNAERRAKNILVNIEGGKTILIHLKMTGHVLYGKYVFDKQKPRDPWQAIEPEALKDPFNKHVRLVFSLSNGRHLALSDVRRFAKVTLVSTQTAHESVHLLGIGPEPLEKSFTIKKFIERLFIRPAGKIKQVITDQSIVAGIGNIYADESLWRAGIYPGELVKNVSKEKLALLFKAIKTTLTHGIKLGGDSMSDYRNIHGEKGAFQEHHFAYRKTGTKCEMKGCKGSIVRISLGGRGTHYCNIHQKPSTNDRKS